MFVKIRVLISGRVQGVFFRHYTKKQAQELGLSGWVHNLPSGQVEAEIIGPEQKVKKMLAWLWQGSPLSKVKNIKITSKENLQANQINSFPKQFIQKL